MPRVRRFSLVTEDHLYALTATSSHDLAAELAFWFNHEFPSPDGLYKTPKDAEPVATHAWGGQIASFSQNWVLVPGDFRSLYIDGGPW